MSVDIDDVFVRQYESEVHVAFQRQGALLMQGVRTKGPITGKSTTFPVAGKGTAAPKTRGGQVPLMNISHTPVECTLNDRYAADTIDKLDELKIHHDERSVVVRNGASALGRTADSFIIDNALSQTALYVGDYSAGLSRNLILEAMQTLYDNDVPNDGMIWGAISPHGWAELMTYEEFQKADYIDPSSLPYMTGKPPKQWLNVNWVMHTGLPLASSDDRDCYLWHHDAVGMAYGSQVQTVITYENTLAAFLVNNMMSMGACLIDGTGVVEIRVDDNAALPA